MGQSLCKGTLKIFLCQEIFNLSGNNIIEEVNNIRLQTKCHTGMSRNIWIFKYLGLRKNIFSSNYFILYIQIHANVCLKIRICLPKSLSRSFSFKAYYHFFQKFFLPRIC